MKIHTCLLFLAFTYVGCSKGNGFPQGGTSFGNCSTAILQHIEYAFNLLGQLTEKPNSFYYDDLGRVTKLNTGETYVYYKDSIIEEKSSCGKLVHIVKYKLNSSDRIVCSIRKLPPYGFIDSAVYVYNSEGFLSRIISYDYNSAKKNNESVFSIRDGNIVRFEYRFGVASTLLYAYDYTYDSSTHIGESDLLYMMPYSDQQNLLPYLGKISKNNVSVIVANYNEAYTDSEDRYVKLNYTYTLCGNHLSNAVCRSSTNDGNTYVNTVQLMYVSKE